MTRATAGTRAREARASGERTENVARRVQALRRKHGRSAPEVGASAPEVGVSAPEVGVFVADTDTRSTEHRIDAAEVGLVAYGVDPSVADTDRSRTEIRIASAGTLVETAEHGAFVHIVEQCVRKHGVAIQGVVLNCV